MGIVSIRGLGAALAFGLFAAHAVAAGERGEVPRGLWQTEPDMFGLVLHVRTRPCGRALCARVERVKDRRGIDAPSNLVSQQVFWSMRQLPDGAFFGEYLDREAVSFPQSRVEFSGRMLRLRACINNTCSESHWTRVK